MEGKRRDETDGSNMRIPQNRLLFVLLLVVVTGLVFYSSLYSVQFGIPKLTRSRSLRGLVNYFSAKEEPKIILDWCGFFGKEMKQSVWMEECPDYNCQLISDREKANLSHAIIFHARDLKWKDIPDNREPWQRYIFFNLESPHHMGQLNLNQIPGFFNWTMTYRKDSDIFLPYGFITNGSLDESYATTDHQMSINDSGFARLAEVVKKKRFPIVWFVSNCQTESRRELYVRELQLYIDVHIYGRCGWNNCSRSEEKFCRAITERDYFFYLAFENSICLDYITEKLWRNVRLWAVPIVLDRQTYRDRLPQGAFIAVTDFSTPAALADYLHYLAGNMTAYMKYFQWRLNRKVYVSQELSNRYTGVCKLCQMLWNTSLPQQSYEDVKQWWHDASNCSAASFREKHIKPTPESVSTRKTLQPSPI